MQFASFDLGDPVYDNGSFRFSLQIMTLENVLGLDPAETSARDEGGLYVVRSAGLTAAGGTMRVRGTALVRMVPGGRGRWRIAIRARSEAPIRCVKLLVRGLETPLSVVEESGERPVGAHGEVLAYPHRLALPLLSVRAGTRRLDVRFEDTRVREKRFALSVEPFGRLAGHGVVEVIHEEEATRFSPEIESPPIVVSQGAEPEQALRDQLAFAERELGLVPWEARRDVPAWARDLRLVVTLHGMHWTGRVFLDYAEMLAALRFVHQRLDGRHVLAYLPGWEGRYYWQYGDYRPEPRLGGETGFARLCEGARELGVHVMPMFGGNCVNARLPRFRELDRSAVLKSATGNRFHGNQPDWDLARAHDTGWQLWLNPGHPAWREELAGQIEGLAQRYGFDAVFLDTLHVWVNDPDHSLHDGIRALVERLRAAIPGVLLAAEHDYDALLPLFALFQRAWWTRDPAWTTRYARRFGHLCEGEPGSRTGVHELGVWRDREEAPAGAARPGYLPTLALQDDTLERHRSAVEAVIAAAAKGG